MSLAPRARLLLLQWDDEVTRSRTGTTFYFGVGCCCHDPPPPPTPPCILVEDHFDREDNTDLNEGVEDGEWSYNPGDQEIEDGVLRFREPDTLVTNDDTTFVGTEDVCYDRKRVQVQLLVHGIGNNKARVMLSSANGFEFDFGAGKIRAMDLGNPTPFVAECDYGLSPNNLYNIDAYQDMRDGDNPLAGARTIHLKLNGLQVMSAPGFTITGSVGVGTGDIVTGVIDFDNFVLLCVSGECMPPRTYCWPFERDAPMEILATVDSMPLNNHDGCSTNPSGCLELAGDTFRLVRQEIPRFAHSGFAVLHLSYQLSVPGYFCGNESYEETFNQINLDVGQMSDGGCRVYMWIGVEGVDPDTGFKLAAWDIRNVPGGVIDNLCGDFPFTLTGVEGLCNVTGQEEPPSTVTLALP